jgi:CBS domain containing-hemolysin-like protein
MSELAAFLSAIGDALAFDTARLLEAELVVRLVLQCFLLAGSAFFSSSETALFSLSQLDLQKLRRERHPRTNTLYRLLEQPRRLIISILCGNELINVASAANMAAILVSLYGPAKAEWINVILMVPLLLLFGEVTPKTIAVSNPVRYSSNVVAVPLLVWVRLIAPLRFAVRFVADRIATLIVGEEKAPENILHIDEFRTLVSEAEEEGGITPTERTLVYNLLAAGTTEIVEIMTPRTQTLFIDADRPITEIVERVHQYRHNRLPVYRGHRDNIIGFLHAEDLVSSAAGREAVSALKLDDLLHPPVGAPPTKKVDEMFQFFQANGAQAAVVINEFGGVDGLITMKAVLRFIFGHLMGPVEGQYLYEERDQNRYVVPGDMKLSDFNNLTHFGVQDPRMTTVGGVLYRHLDRLAGVGDSVQFEGMTMTVLALDGHRIARVAVERGGRPEEVSEPEAGR